MADRDLILSFERLEDKIRFFRKLRRVNAANEEILANGNVLLVFSEESKSEIYSFKGAGDALDEYFDRERAGRQKDVVLVRADTGKDIRTAFQNYVSDTVDFVRFVDESISLLG